MRHVVFRLEKDRYALPLSAIREVVVVPDRFSRVPRAPPHVKGIMNLRGRIVTVVELSALLKGGPSSASGAGAKVVLLDSAGGASSVCSSPRSTASRSSRRCRRLRPRRHRP